MKKFIAILLSICILALPAVSFAACPASDVVNVLVNGKSVSCDANPYIENGRTMVPFRAICEALGCKVGYDENTGCVSAENGSCSVAFKAGECLTNNCSEAADAASCIKDGRTYVPLRSFCEIFGCDVNWDGSSNCASINQAKTDDTEAVDSAIKIITSSKNCTSNKNCTTAATAKSTILSTLQNLLNKNTQTNKSTSNNASKQKSQPAATATPAPEKTTSVQQPATENTPSQSDSQSIGSYEQEVLRLVNEQRAKYGLSALTYSKSLEAVAYAHSRDMAQNNYFSHTNLKGQSPFDRLASAKITYRAAAENIAAGQKTPAAVVDAWMNSEGHRKNILNSSVKQMGLGVYQGGSYGIYWTQLFIG